MSIAPVSNRGSSALDTAIVPTAASAAQTNVRITLVT
jgi:hypothetical protein